MYLLRQCRPKMKKKIQIMWVKEEKYGQFGEVKTEIYNLRSSIREGHNELELNKGKPK
jgi:hypothetical protein